MNNNALNNYSKTQKQTNEQRIKEHNFDVVMYDCLWLVYHNKSWNIQTKIATYVPERNKFSISWQKQPRDDRGGTEEEENFPDLP